jgi:hypothetical protein
MSGNKNVTRDRIVRAVADVLEPLDYVYAMWEGGAVAFDRVDEWSDVDICVDAADDRVEEAFPVVEQALESLAPIELKYDVTGPKLGEYVQAFYRLEGTSEFMLVDFAVFKHSAPDKLLEPEIHGASRFHFNKGDAVKIPHLDRDGLHRTLGKRVEDLGKRFEMFACFVIKEIERGNYIEAHDFYNRFVLGSLVEALRIKHKPVRHDFRTRYVHHDLPPEVVKELVGLYFVKEHEDLRQKYEAASKWFRRTITDLTANPLGSGLAF